MQAFHSRSKGRNLHDEVHLVFTAPWQSAVRRDGSRARLDALYQRFETDYGEVRRLRDWIYSHAEREVPRSIIVIVVIAETLALAYTLFPRMPFPGGCPHRGNPFDRWESAASTFKIRITAYEEERRTISASRPYYIFESNGLGPDDWRGIMTIQDESRPDIPRNQVRFVTN